MKRYLTIFTLLFVTEIAIAIFHFHKFVRGFVGDLLVIPLVYTFLRAFTKLSVRSAIIGTMTLAVFVEVLQLFKLAEYFEITNRVFTIVLGSVFDWYDLLAYALGLVPILFIEKFRNT